jgi:hypothetical protein
MGFFGGFSRLPEPDSRHLKKRDAAGWKWRSKVLRREPFKA